MVIRCHKCGASVVSIAGNVAFDESPTPPAEACLPIGDIAGIGQLNPTTSPDTIGSMSYDELLAMVANNDIARTILLRALSLASVYEPTPPKPGIANTSPSSPP